MKKSIYLLLGLCLLVKKATAQKMLVEISSPVESEFALYQPLLVHVIPNAPTNDVGANLEKVANLKAFDFSPTALSLLQKNHFVVTPAIYKKDKNSAFYNEMFDIYCECRENNIPIFITSDALLHTFHLCFDYILKTCEEKKFFHQLNQLLSLLLDATEQQLATTNEDKIRSALVSNYNYLIVAKKSLDSTYVEKINGGPYLQELALIDAAMGISQSPIFGYNEDYSQYRVRGHYTRSSLLRHYFKSMMWLGRMTFSCENAQGFFSREATLRALLLCQAMQKTSPHGMALWQAIYQPTVFFVGKSDDINFLHYLPLAQTIYGDGWADQSPDMFNDETLLTNFIETAQTLPAGAIGYPGQPQKGFRFMGQRFIPDSWILDELVFNKIPDRFIPTGLDVMYVLGSDRAKTHLPAKDLNNPLYLAKLDSLRNVFAEFPPETWAQNVYWNWLYSLMPLLAPKGNGYPYFMQTLAWLDKDLFAALASWAELRHDTILYAKQSGTETSLPPSAIQHQGYVEPNPHLFARLAALANYTKNGLQQRGLLFQEFATALEIFLETAITCKQIAEKELTDEPLSSDEYYFIYNIGKTLYRIISFGKGNEKGPLPGGQDGLEPMPVIADVHTDANTMTVLEEGVGHPYAIYVICNIEGRPLIAKGAGYSYYEFTWPANDRLTDEKWRQMLKDGSAPQPPVWSSNFCTDHPLPQKNESAFYRWQKPYTKAIEVSLNKNSAVVGDSIRLDIASKDYLYIDQNPQVTLIDPNGATYTMQTQRYGEPYQSRFMGWLNTAAFSPGRYYIDITVVLTPDTLFYRTHFDLQTNTKVASNNKMLSNFAIMSNYPNPFNANTTISIEIPKTSLGEVTIFDITGKLIRRLFSGTLQQGTCTFNWDGCDLHGLHCPSGIYVCRFSSEDGQMYRRLLLMR